jgi:hypothetical protein
VFLFTNSLFIVALTTGLLHAVDFREVRITNPILGVVPRRLAGVLGISFLTAAGLMVMWGRMFEGGPTAVEISPGRRSSGRRRWAPRSGTSFPARAEPYRALAGKRLQQPV